MLFKSAVDDDNEDEGEDGVFNDNRLGDEDFEDMDRVENGFGIGVLILLSFEVIWDSNSSTGELFCNFNKLSSTSRIAVSLLDTLNTLEGGGGVEVINVDDEV
ncbi:unnamed protein product [[Candida] boidinii]|uniref:Unnamed protein product n=1 Tax=Candida boidinii TaxID=5477 RepID=A0ACB5UA07_CANBO|nr:unnamed protein product [[Candida] boidinii]